MQHLTLALALGIALAGCAAEASYIPGTRVDRSTENQALIDRIEDYRMAVERKDASALVLMASKRY